MRIKYHDEWRVLFWRNKVRYDPLMELKTLRIANWSITGWIVKYDNE